MFQGFADSFFQIGDNNMTRLKLMGTYLLFATTLLAISYITEHPSWTVRDMVIICPAVDEL